LRVRLGVEYISVDVASARTPGAMLLNNGASSGPTLSQIPCSMLEDLRIAAIHADYDRLMALADQMAGLDPESARVVRQIVERFDYQKLIDYAQGGQGHV